LAINKMRRLTKSGTMLALIEKQLKQEIQNTSSASLLPTVVGSGPGTSPFARSVVVLTSCKVADASANAAMMNILDKNNIPFALCRLSVEQNTDSFQSLFANSPSAAYPLLFVGDELIGVCVLRLRIMSTPRAHEDSPFAFLTQCSATEIGSW
jgi:hypothetical protein